MFCGGSLFNADVGSARSDFPGGDAHALCVPLPLLLSAPHPDTLGSYRSATTKLLSFPATYNIYTGRDYPPARRSRPQAATTVAQQRALNKAPQGRHARGRLCPLAHRARPRPGRAEAPPPYVNNEQNPVLLSTTRDWFRVSGAKGMKENGLPRIGPLSRGHLPGNQRADICWAEALQVNSRGARLPAPREAAGGQGDRLLHVPLKVERGKAW